MRRLPAVSDSTTDPLSPLLETVQLGQAQYCLSRLVAPFNIAFADRPWPMLHVMVEGHGVLLVKGERPVVLDAGDLVLLPRASHHGLSDEAQRPERLVEFAPGHSQRTSPRYHQATEGRCTLVCAQFRLEGPLVVPVLERLPPVWLVRGQQQEPWLQSTLALLSAEASEPRAGTDAIIGALLQVLFVQVLRRQEAPGLGWASATRHAGIGRALAAIHATPASDLSVERLARLAGLARSRFVQRFTDEVGVAPGRYVLRWRMQRAASALHRDGEVPLKALSADVGYASVAAFKRAFKQVVGQPPGAYRRASAARREAGARSHAAGP
jgi:AraC-like DNA-binding protein